MASPSTLALRKIGAVQTFNDVFVHGGGRPIRKPLGQDKEMERNIVDHHRKLGKCAKPKFIRRELRKLVKANKAAMR